MQWHKLAKLVVQSVNGKCQSVALSVSDFLAGIKVINTHDYLGISRDQNFLLLSSKLTLRGKTTLRKRYYFDPFGV